MTQPVLGDTSTSDFTIVAEQREIPVHRSVLTRTSPFLNSFLTSDTSCTRINANNAKHEAMLIVLAIMYAAGTPQAEVISSTTGPSFAFANSRYDFSIILSAWEIGMHFQLSEVASSAVKLLLPLLSKYTCVRALRSCLKHPKDEGANHIKEVAATFLPPLQDTEDQRADWRVLKEKYPIVVQLAAEQEEKERLSQEAKMAEERERAASALAQQRQELEREREQNRLEMERQLSQHHASLSPAPVMAIPLHTSYNNNNYQQGFTSQSASVPNSGNTSHVAQGSFVEQQNAYTHASYPPSHIAPSFSHRQQSTGPAFGSSPFQHRNTLQSSYDGASYRPNYESVQPLTQHFDHNESAPTYPPNMLDRPASNSPPNGLRLRNGTSLSPQRTAAQASEMAMLQQQLATLKLQYQRQQEEQRHEEEHLKMLLSDIGAHDVDISEVQQELTLVTKEVDAALKEQARLEEEEKLFSDSVKENEEYVRNAKVYIPAAREAASLLTSNVDTIMRNAATTSKTTPREMLKTLLADLRKDKGIISSELQEAQRVGSDLKHHIQVEKAKTDGITSQLLELKASS